MPFDPDSGLIYSEEVLSVQRSCRCRDATWTRGSKADQGRRGDVQALRDLAIRRILSNLHLLDPATLSAVPTSLVEALWEAVRRSNLGSVKVWQVFAQSHSGSAPCERHWQSRFCRLHRLPYFIDVAAASECWLTNLNLDCIDVSVQDLVHVINLRNVQTVNICGYKDIDDRAPSDRIVRTWAEASLERGAFSKLEMLSISSCKDVTARSLDYLSSFPKLDIFCSQDCGLNVVQRGHQVIIPLGWRINDVDTPAQFARSLPSEQRWSLSKTDIMARYFRHRSNPGSSESTSQPVLHLDLHRPSAASALLYMHLDSTLCLVRDHSIPTASNGVIRMEVGSDLIQAMAKRRRVKGGKSVALNEMLAGM